MHIRSTGTVLPTIFFFNATCIVWGHFVRYAGIGERERNRATDEHRCGQRREGQEQRDRGA
jgi:hypothetical protein